MVHIDAPLMKERALQVHDANYNCAYGVLFCSSGAHQRAPCSRAGWHINERSSRDSFLQNGAQAKSVEDVGNHRHIIVKSKRNFS